MLEIRLHGRGGQGVVTAAELIAIAAFKDGFESQAFPNFGVERRGAPIQAYTRISKEKIRLRSQIYEPDFLIIQDDTLFGVVDLFKGVKKETKVVINSSKKLNEIFSNKLPLKKENFFIVDATKIALDILGKPIINTVMLGAFAQFSGLIKVKSIKDALREKFSGEILNKNIQATEYAFNLK